MHAPGLATGPTPPISLVRLTDTGHVHTRRTLDRLQHEAEPPCRTSRRSLRCIAAHSSERSRSRWHPPHARRTAGPFADSPLLEKETALGNIAVLYSDTNGPTSDSALRQASFDFLPPEGARRRAARDARRQQSDRGGRRPARARLSAFSIGPCSRARRRWPHRDRGSARSMRAPYTDLRVAFRFRRCRSSASAAKAASAIAEPRGSGATNANDVETIA